MKSNLTRSVAPFNDAKRTEVLKYKNNFGKLKRAKIIRDKDSKDINLINDLKKKETLYVPDEDLEAKLKKIKEEQERLKRSYSSDIDIKQNQRYKTLKQSEYFNEQEKKSNIKNNKTYLNEIKEEEIEEIKSFGVDCNLYDKNNKIYIIGKCFIDKNYMFYFRDEMNDKSQYFNNLYYTFPLLCISRCETNSGYFGPSKYCKEILLKDNRNFVLKFSPKSFYEFNEIIEKFVLPAKSQKYFNFAYYFNNKKKTNKNVKLYNLIEEFKRQGINFESNKQFRLLNNKNFQLCESYPKDLIVPYDMSDDEIKESSKFRTKNRIPTLTYRYSENGNCIWRSSQAKSGFKSMNKYDVLLLTKISNNKQLNIYDARPLINAYANKFKGAGFENLSDYKDININLIFCGMSNIHSVRNSYYKLLNNATYNTNYESTLFINIANSGWYEAIIILLKSSFQIYNNILENSNILVHCSDGWDRTSQLCSMSQILLDKYYRTLDGFICLIEKDWMSFGHQFRYRNGMYSPIDTHSKVASENQFSPIFIQWLDSLYQLMEQNYTKFQFNFNLLLFLADEMYTGKYGTFLFNNDKEREDYCEGNTLSVWNYIKENEEEFINPIYDPEDGGNLYINYKNIKLWKDYFLKYEKENTKYILGEYDKKIKMEEKIIEKLYKFIGNKYDLKEIEGLDVRSKILIKKLIK